MEESWEEPEATPPDAAKAVEVTGSPRRRARAAAKVKGSPKVGKKGRASLKGSNVCFVCPLKKKSKS